MGPLVREILWRAHFITIPLERFVNNLGCLWWTTCEGMVSALFWVTSPTPCTTRNITSHYLYSQPSHEKWSSPPDLPSTLLSGISVTPQVTLPQTLCHTIRHEPPIWDITHQSLSLLPLSMFCLQLSSSCWLPRDLNSWTKPSMWNLARGLVTAQVSSILLVTASENNYICGIRFPTHNVAATLESHVVQGLSGSALLH